MKTEKLFLHSSSTAAGGTTGAGAVGNGMSACLPC